MAEPSGPDTPTGTATETPTGTTADELDDQALDAVVGGIGVDAALARAAAYDAGLLG